MPNRPRLINLAFSSLLDVLIFHTFGFFPLSILHYACLTMGSFSFLSLHSNYTLNSWGSKFRKHKISNWHKLELVNPGFLLYAELSLKTSKSGGNRANPVEKAESMEEKQIRWEQSKSSGRKQIQWKKANPVKAEQIQWKQSQSGGSKANPEEA